MYTDIFTSFCGLFGLVWFSPIWFGYTIKNQNQTNKHFPRHNPVQIGRDWFSLVVIQTKDHPQFTPGVR
jgi:hypothetical protein